MPEVKFGLSQLANETPKWAGYVTNSVLGVAAMWAIFSPQITELSDPTRADITRWALIITGILKYLSKGLGKQPADGYDKPVI